MHKKMPDVRIVFAGALILSIWLPYEMQAQSIKRSCIPCYGSSMVTENLFMSQTAGQNYFTLSSDEEKTIVLQGFQQPVKYAMSDINLPTPEELKISISPNPASHSLTIKCQEALENPYVVVTDLNGKNLLSSRIPEISDHVINCESWNNGVYYLTIYGDQGRKKTMRLIILK
jgi:hypothetical protein